MMAKIKTVKGLEGIKEEYMKECDKIVKKHMEELEKEISDLRVKILTKIISKNNAKANSTREEVKKEIDKDYENELCEYCNGLKKIRNPTGNCDHLYYPDNVNKEFAKGHNSEGGNDEKI